MTACKRPRIAAPLALVLDRGCFDDLRVGDESLSQLGSR